MAGIGLDTFSDMVAHLQTLLNDSTNSFYDEDTRKRAINLAYLAIWNQACLLNSGQGPVVSTASLTITANTDTVQLPADFHKIVYIYYRDSDSNWISWEPDGPVGRSKHINQISQSSDGRFYSVRPVLSGGSMVYNLVISPIPEETEVDALKLEYIPTFTKLDADGDAPVFQETVRELIVYEALARLLQKEKMDMPQLAYRVWQELKEKFESSQDQPWTVQEEGRIQGDDDYDLYEG